MRMTRRSIAVILLALLVCVVSAAFGIELTWNQTCTKKTSASTTLYVKLSDDSDELTATSTLPAGTYIHVSGKSIDGKTGISYSNNNSDPLYGYIDGSVIVSATASYTLKDGRVVTLPEALVRSKAALDVYLEMEYGETSEGKTYTDGEGNEQEIGNENAGGNDGGNRDAQWYEGMAKAAMKNGSYTPTVYRDADGNETEVKVVYMGLARSMISINGEQKLVDTCNLTWETTAPEDKVIAVVDAEKNGYVKLHAKMSSKSLVMDHILTTQVLRVIGTGNNWTMVDYNGIRGYVATSYLMLLPNVPVKYQTGMISVKGRTKGSDPVWVRSQDNSKTGRYLDKYDLGTPVTIYAGNGRWYEIDVCGYHCYIKVEYVTLDQPEATASAAGAAE